MSKKAIWICRPLAFAVWRWKPSLGRDEKGVHARYFTFSRGVTRRWAEPTLPARVDAMRESSRWSVAGCRLGICVDRSQLVFIFVLLPVQILFSCADLSSRYLAKLL